MNNFSFLFFFLFCFSFFFSFFFLLLLSSSSLLSSASRNTSMEAPFIFIFSLLLLSSFLPFFPSSYPFQPFFLLPSFFFLSFLFSLSCCPFLFVLHFDWAESKDGSPCYDSLLLFFSLNLFFLHGLIDCWSRLWLVQICCSCCVWNDRIKTVEAPVAIEGGC